MPLPSYRPHTFVNQAWYNGRPNGSPKYQTVFIGRTSWTGNQRRRRSKFSPPTNCLSTVESHNTGTYWRGDESFGYQGSHAFAFSNTLAEIVETKPSPRAASAALRKAVSAFSSNAGLGETIAETPSSLRLIGRRSTTIYQILRLAGRGRFRAAGDRLRSATGYNVSNRSIRRLEKKFSEAKKYDSRRASSFWLEHQFGFVPLFQSIFDSVNAIADNRQLHRKSANVDGYRFGIYGGVNSKTEFTLSQLGLTNPASLAWDLVPFSFVLDWFLPIGLILRWIGSTRGLTVAYAWSSETHVRTITRRGVWESTRTNYIRTARALPTIGEVFNATPRSHGLWTVVTAVALFDTLR